MNAGQSQSRESVVKEIRRESRRKFLAEEKIRILLNRLKGQAGIAGLSRAEGSRPDLTIAAPTALGGGAASLNCQLARKKVTLSNGLPISCASDQTRAW